MIKYVFRNSAEYFNFIDQLTRTRNEPGAVANNKLTVRTVNYIYSRTSGLNQYFDMYLYHWTLDDIQEAIESPVYIRPDGYVVLEMPAFRYSDRDFFDRMLAAKRIVDTLKEWCENQGYALCNDYIRDDDVVRFDIAYMGRTGHYHFKLCQINDFDDVEKGIKNTMEHFENNYGKRAMAERLLNSQYGLESRNIPMVGARCLPKSLQNTIYGVVSGSIPMSNEVREALNYFKEVNDSMFKRIPDITKVIHNDPATIVFWSDGEKTVVKAENEAYDPEKGIAMAITKKVLGNKGNYYNTIRKWLPKEEE